MLPRRCREAVRRMVRARGLPETEENLAQEAFELRLRNGWFLFEYPSTFAAVKTRRMFDLEPEMPVRNLFE